MTKVALYHDEWWFACVHRHGDQAAHDVPEELVVRWEQAVIELRAARNAIYAAANLALDDYDKNQPE